MSEAVGQDYRDYLKHFRWLYSVWGVIFSIPLLVLALDMDKFASILLISATALVGTIPYIIVAVLLLAYLKASGAEAIIANAFKGREYRMILLAAVFGGIAPFCSCEVIPFIAGLLALGVPLSAVMAFWLSSPLIDPASFSVTAGALGWEFAAGKTAAAVLLGIGGGFLVSLMIRQGAFAEPLLPRESGGGCRTSSPFEGKPVWKFWKETDRIERFRNEFLSNGIFLFKWLTLAYLLEGLLVTYIPADMIAQVVGGEGLLPIVIGAIVGAPAYLNSYAAPALVAGLIEQGMSNSSAMAFMISGSVSSIPAMAAVWSLVKRTVFITYMICGIGGAIVLGSLFGFVMSFS